MVIFGGGGVPETGREKSNLARLLYDGTRQLDADSASLF
jgi:hypothetical protein